MLQFATYGNDELDTLPLVDRNYWHGLKRNLAVREAKLAEKQAEAAAAPSSEVTALDSLAPQPKMRSLTAASGAVDRMLSCDTRVKCPSDLAAQGYFDDYRLLNILHESLHAAETEIELIPEPERLPVEWQGTRYEFDAQGNGRKRRGAWVIAWEPISRFTTRRIAISGLSIGYNGEDWVMPAPINQASQFATYHDAEWWLYEQCDQPTSYHTMMAKIQIKLEQFNEIAAEVCQSGSAADSGRCAILDAQPIN